MVDEVYSLKNPSEAVEEVETLPEEFYNKPLILEKGRCQQWSINFFSWRHDLCVYTIHQQRQNIFDQFQNCVSSVECDNSNDDNALKFWVAQSLRLVCGTQMLQGHSREYM